MYEPLQNKMLEYSVPPPMAAWDHIAARLNDDERYAAVSAKLEDFEITVPAQNKIRVFEQLSIGQKAKLSFPQSPVIYRLAAAVIIAGILVITWAIVKTGIGVTPKIPADAISAAGSKTQHTIGANTTMVANAAGLRADTGYQNSSLRFMKESESFIGASFSDDVMRYALISNRKIFHPRSRIKAPPLPDWKTNLIFTNQFFSMDSHYLLVERPGGQLIRISAKFRNVIRLFSETGNTNYQPDLEINEGIDWKQRLAEWRNKISESSYIPASPNFLDILSLKDLILEEQ